MKRRLLVASLAWLTALPPARSQGPAALPPAALVSSNVVVTLSNGTTVEGILKDQDDRQIQLEEQLAGGTILQTETIARTNIVAITALSPLELAARAEAAAWQNLERYRLNPQSSYSAEYYDQVIENVFRPFLSTYPGSPHVTDVADRLRQWQAERRQVADGRAKYQGRWMSAKEAGPLLAREQAAQRFQQARQDLQRGQYERALATLRLVDTPEARTLSGRAYEQWSRALETERSQLQQEISKAQQEVSAAIEKKNKFESATRQHASSGLNSGGPTWIGPSQTDLFALNKARNDISVGSNDLRHLEGRLVVVQHQLDLVGNAAQKQAATNSAVTARTTAGSTSGRVVDEPVRDIQSPIVQRENWDEPSVLHQIANYGREYWLAAVIVVVVGLAVLTWKLAK